MLEINKIYNMDCLVGMKSIPSESIDLIVTDPPYKLTSRGTSGNMGGAFWTGDLAKSGKVFESGSVDISDWIDECYRVLKNGTHIYIMTNDKNITSYLSEIDKSGFEFVKTLVWVKPNKICGRWYMTQKETIILARKGKQRPINNAGTSDVLFTPNFKKQKSNGKNLHDTEKPVELLQTFVENSSNEGETVLDPFMGIGSTAVACINTNRNYIGFELSEEYCKIAEKRISEATSNQIELPEIEHNVPQRQFDWLDELLEGE